MDIVPTSYLGVYYVMARLQHTYIDSIFGTCMLMVHEGSDLCNIFPSRMNGALVVGV